ncbi:MAG: hypothetical protein HKN43_14125 [Rhodothermales bacterium]|nr:hypothetical protein [Rhodothermales bacterium]
MRVYGQVGPSASGVASTGTGTQPGFNVDTPRSDSLPIVIPDSLIKPLRNLVDDELQSRLDNIVASNQKLARLAAANKIGIALVDLRDPQNVKFARTNGSNMMYAASLPKIAILLAAMDAIEKGELQETPEVTNDMHLMISRSNNAASTRMIDRLGYEKISSVLQDPKYELYDEEFGGGLWVGKRYAKSGGRNPDPLKGLSHAATATQVARYYYLLAFGKLVSYERSKQMLSIMTDPGIHHKFVNTLDSVAPRARLFRKSGSWRSYHSDSVLVWGPVWRRYILVALVDDSEGEKILRQLMLDVDRLLKPAAE